MKLSEFKGVNSKLSHLLQSLKNGNIMHAMIFDGPDGTGKRSMADIMTRAALCTSELERPCDVCSACRKCLSDAHPDVHVVALEDDRKQIRIEQIRALQERLSLSSYEGGKKIVIIEDADTMNNSAQNAILKTLEEPTGDTLFFLLTNSPGGLLPTIRSRCLPVHFSALSINECSEVLVTRGIEKEKAIICASIASGCVGKALDLARDENYFPLRDKIIDSIESVTSDKSVPAAVAKIGKIKDSEVGDGILEIMEQWAWDLMRVQNGLSPNVAANEKQLKHSTINGNKLLRSVMRAEQKRNANVGWSNIIEPILFGIVDERLK